MRTILYFAAWIFSLSNVMGQGSNILRGKEPSKDCIYKQQKKLARKFKKADCYNSVNNFDYLFIYTYGLRKKPTSDLLINNQILNESDVLYRKNSKFPINHAIIYSQKKGVIAYSEDPYVYCFYSNSNSLKNIFEAVVDYLIKQKPEKIFMIDATPFSLFFAKKGKEIEALVFDKDDQIKVLSMEEFVECCWDEYFPQDHLEIYYDSNGSQ